MDSPQPVRDATAWPLAAAYIEAWNKRDREAWLALLHPDLEFRPTALVGPRIVYHGIDGAARYFDGLIASERAEQAEISLSSLDCRVCPANDEPLHELVPDALVPNVLLYQPPFDPENLLC